MRGNRGRPLLLALAVAFGAVAAGCEGDETVVEDEENGGDGGGEDSGDGGGDDSDLDVDVG